MQLGGYDAAGRDDTNPVSFLILEAIDRLRVPANIGVCGGRRASTRRLLSRGVAMQFANRNGIPKFLGVDRTAEGFARNGYPLALGHQRVYAGCHWSAIPGREYTLNDIPKIHLGVVFDVALRDMMATGARRRLDGAAVHVLPPAPARAPWTCSPRGLDLHMRHMGEVFPELVIDLLCHGTIEKGLDAAAGGVEFVDLCVDGAALATVADSFAAIEQRIEREHRLRWEALIGYLDSDWAGADGERARQLMKSSARFGSGGSMADRVGDARRGRLHVARGRAAHARRVADGARASSRGRWCIAMGRELGATPNGRRAGDPISSRRRTPTPGFRRDGARHGARGRGGGACSPAGATPRRCRWTSTRW